MKKVAPPAQDKKLNTCGSRSYIDLFKFPTSICNTFIAQNLRNTLWKREITGATMPVVQEQAQLLLNQTIFCIKNLHAGEIYTSKPK